MKPKVLLIQSVLFRYREPIYRIMSEQVDLTLAYTNRCEIEDSSYTIIKLPSFKIGPLTIHRHVNRILNQYDVVILLPHLNFIRLNMIAFQKHKYKLVTWSIGLHVSYNKHYDLNVEPTFKDKVFEAIQDRADACIFYMPEPIEYWKKHKNINIEKYFVAHNTVAVEPFIKLPDFTTKDSLLFVVTLYKQKGIGELMEACAIAKKKVGRIPKLDIVGKGPEKDSIENQIHELGLEGDVNLCGPIFDDKILKEYFFKSILCISPKQAGLSVLKSLGYGVPFVTRTDAITGGEKSNIIDKENGLFYDSVDELANIIADTITNPNKYEIMCQNARNYYLNNATPEKMAQGALDAISYALSH